VFGHAVDPDADSGQHSFAVARADAALRTGRLNWQMVEQGDLSFTEG